jgi:DNA replicative helicase MCM subunit Mcm2 (Cdc46/Mcm family)
MDRAEKEDLIIEAKKFFDSYKKEFGNSIRKGSNVIFIDFMKLTEFSNKLSDEILANPEDALRIIELSIEESGLVRNARVRLVNLPEELTTKIENISFRDYNRLIVVEGKIKGISNIGIKTIKAKFECLNCGSILSIYPKGGELVEPDKCSCGKKRNFFLINREQVDNQQLILEGLDEKRRGIPNEISIDLNEDLVNPETEDKIYEGRRVKIVGVLNEIPIRLSKKRTSIFSNFGILVNNIFFI